MFICLFIYYVFLFLFCFMFYILYVFYYFYLFYFVFILFFIFVFLCCFLCFVYRCLLFFIFYLFYFLFFYFVPNTNYINFNPPTPSGGDPAVRPENQHSNTFGNSHPRGAGGKGVCTIGIKITICVCDLSCHRI